MPLQLNRSDKKILLAAAVAFIVLILAALLLTSPGSNRQAQPTTYSADSNGAKAAFLLLEESGYHVERWEKPLSEIPSGNNTVLILAEPSQIPPKRDRDALHRFIGGGGRLIAAGPLATDLLPGNPSVRTDSVARTWDIFLATAPSAITRAAPQITLAPQARWVSPWNAVALYGRKNETVVVQYSYGEGDILWWASATPLTNAGLREPGNLEFFLACLGDRDASRILFDEYQHGYGRTGSFDYEYTLAASMLIQLAVLGLAVVWTYSRRSGPVRPSGSEVRLSPLEFVETLGGLYRHAGASSVAVDIVYQRFRFLLARRLGISGKASPDDFERILRARWSFRDDAFAVTLKKCAAVRHQPDIAPGQALDLVRALHSYAAELNLYSTSAKENS